jgi:hypothetical protein
MKGPIEASIGKRTGTTLDSMVSAGLLVKHPGGLYSESEEGRKEIDAHATSRSPRDATGPS